MTPFAGFWQTAFAVVVIVLAARVTVMAWAAARRELAWSRLLLPGIILVESAGMWWHDRTSLWQLRLATALALEIAFIAIAIRELRRSARGSEPLEARLSRAFAALLPPRAARLVALELVIVGSALRFLAGGWRRALPAGFTYHRECGLRMMLPILPLLGIGDILLLELVILPHAAMWLRVLLHVLALYGIVWIIGFYASLRTRPHQLADGHLTLHRGLLRRVDVQLAQIATVTPLPSFGDDWQKRAYTKGAIRVDVAGPPVLELRLHEAVRPIGVLGQGAPATRVLVAVDDPTSFLRQLRP